MKIATNMAALKGQNNLNKVNELKNKSLEKLTTGSKINSASDDAAGLSIATKFDSQIRGMQTAAKNANDGAALLSVAESAMGEMTEILQRARELTLTAANGTMGSDEKTKITTELKELTKEIDNIAEKTNFNGIDLLGGDTIKLQVGANKDEVEEIELVSASVTDLGLDAADDIDVSDSDKANEYLEKIDTALSTLANGRATMGAKINRLNYTVSNLNTSIEGLTSAKSNITDTDMAAEMGNFSRNNVLSQAGTSMLAQAMQSTQSVLSLLG